MTKNSDKTKKEHPYRDVILGALGIITLCGFALYITSAYQYNTLNLKEIDKQSTIKYNKKQKQREKYTKLREKIFTLADRNKKTQLGLNTNEKIDLYQKAMGFNNIWGYNIYGNIYLDNEPRCGWEYLNKKRFPFEKNRCTIQKLEQALEYYQKNP